jgi:hypothetical protein
MIPYRARLLDIMMNNNANPGYWEKPVVFPIYKGEIDRQLESTDRSAELRWFANKWIKL